MSICVICGKKFTGKSHCVTCGSESCKATRRSQIMAEYWAGRRHMRICEICGKEFQCHPSAKTVTCSPKCRSEKFRRQALSLRTKNIKICVICGREFADAPSNTRVTCRRQQCTAWARSNSAKPDYEAMRRGIAASPLLQPDERHVNARDWALVAPDGTEYRFRNLRHFVRTHQHLFTEDELRISGVGKTDPLASVKLGHLRPGAKHPYDSWHGWSWAN